MSALVLETLPPVVLAELERRARARNRTPAEEAATALNAAVLSDLGGGQPLRPATDSSVPYELPGLKVKGVARGRPGPRRLPDMVFPEAPGGDE